MEKNNEPASAIVSSVSPATARACVRASRVNGVVMNACAPTRRGGTRNGSQPVSDITCEANRAGAHRPRALTRPRPVPRQVPGSAPAGPSATCRPGGRGSEPAEDGAAGGEVHPAGLVDVEPGDLAVLDQRGEALAAGAQPEAAAVELEAQRPGELGVAVGEHHDLVADLVLLRPGAHDEGVVDRHAG